MTRVATHGDWSSQDDSVQTALERNLELVRQLLERSATMKTKQLLISFLAAFSLQISVAGCVDSSQDDDIELAEPSDEASDAKADATNIAFTEVDVGLQSFIPNGDLNGFVKVIKSQRQYENVFGADVIALAAVKVDFSKEWVAVFSAGQQSNCGFSAAIDSIKLSNKTLSISTRLNSPGPSCFTTQNISLPNIAVKFAKPSTTVKLTRYNTVEKEFSCSEGAGVGELCANGVFGTPNIPCADGLTCVLNDFDPPPNVQSSGPTGTCQFVEQKECNVGGCSGQICSDEEGLVSTCEFRPEYACYAEATCERQTTGECGWTPTTELTSCIDNAR
jgi:hypothetical protein